jgi:hypothetical protein
VAKAPCPSKASFDPRDPAIGRLDAQGFEKPCVRRKTLRQVLRDLVDVNLVIEIQQIGIDAPHFASDECEGNTAGHVIIGMVNLVANPESVLGDQELNLKIDDWQE